MYSVRIGPFTFLHHYIFHYELCNFIHVCDVVSQIANLVSWQCLLMLMRLCRFGTLHRVILCLNLVRYTFQGLFNYCQWIGLYTLYFDYLDKLSLNMLCFNIEWVIALFQVAFKYFDKNAKNVSPGYLILWATKISNKVLM